MESISRISSVLEAARDLTIEAARDANSSRRANPSQPLSTAHLKKLLDSRNDREVLEGLRRVIARTAHSQQTGPPLLFSSVLKNIASPSLPIKKLVYVYLLQNAEAEPDTALLAINTIQKSLSAPDPQLRALALRVMSGIRVPVISQIVSLGIKKGCADMSPLVRRAAALAIPKCWALDPGTAPQMVEYLGALLGDRQYFVVGAAVSTFMECCPERLELIHPQYRSLIRKLVDMDEWGQLATLKLMLIYARRCFPKRVKRVAKADANNVSLAKGFYEDIDEQRPDTRTGDIYEEMIILDPDLEALLKAAMPLLQSRNSAVVVAVTRLYLYLAPEHPTYLPSAVGPLMSLLRRAQSTQQIALHSIIQVALTVPAAFVRYATHFLIRATDPPQTWTLKLELLTIIFPHSKPRTQSLILNELSHLSSWSSSPLAVRESVRAIGRCAQASPPSSPTSDRCMRLLLTHLSSTNGSLVAESLTVIRHLIQAAPSSHAAMVVRLAKSLDTMTNPSARATIIWLVGEFPGTTSRAQTQTQTQTQIQTYEQDDSNSSNSIAADVLRILAKGFADEVESVKLQILLLAAKVYVRFLNAQHAAAVPTADTEANGDLTEHDGNSNGNGNGNDDPQTLHPIPKLWSYILLLTRYDTSYDLRDRARTLRALLPDRTSSSPSDPASAAPDRATMQLATLLLLVDKPAPHVPSPSANRRDYMLGSASLVLGSETVGAAGLRGYEGVPEWVQEGKEPAARLRDEAGGVAAVVAVTSMGSGISGGVRGLVATSASDRLEALTKGKGGAGGTAAAGKTLDDWLAESEGESESESEGEGEGEEEGESEDEEDAESEEESSSDEEDEKQGLVKR